MLNSYRVLLTRARKGMVIWVPSSTRDETAIDFEYLDATAQLIVESGIQILDG